MKKKKTKRKKKQTNKQTKKTPQHHKCYTFPREVPFWKKKVLKTHLHVDTILPKNKK
jgi:hypothetical protein